MTTKKHPRYDGRPLVRLLELYVLWAIDELADEDEAAMEAMAPRLQSLYQIQGRWQDVIAGSLKMPADMPQALMAMWQKNQTLAHQHGTVLTPLAFAEMVVDENFAN